MQAKTAAAAGERTKPKKITLFFYELFASVLIEPGA